MQGPNYFVTDAGEDDFLSMFEDLTSGDSTLSSLQVDLCEMMKEYYQYFQVNETNSTQPELPHELISYILSLADLSRKDFAAVLITNKLFYRLSGDNVLWQQLIDKYLPYLKFKNEEEYKENPRSAFNKEFRYLKSAFGHRLDAKNDSVKRYRDQTVDIDLLLQVFNGNFTLHSQFRALDEQTQMWLKGLAVAYGNPWALKNLITLNGNFKGSFLFIPGVRRSYIAGRTHFHQQEPRMTSINEANDVIRIMALANNVVVPGFLFEKNIQQTSYQIALTLAIKRNDFRTVKYILQNFDVDIQVNVDSIKRTIANDQLEMFELLVQYFPDMHKRAVQELFKETASAGKSLHMQKLYQKYHKKIDATCKRYALTIAGERCHINTTIMLLSLIGEKNIKVYTKELCIALNHAIASKKHDMVELLLTQTHDVIPQHILCKRSCEKDNNPQPRKKRALKNDEVEQENQTFLPSFGGLKPVFYVIDENKDEIGIPNLNSEQEVSEGFFAKRRKDGRSTFL